MQKHQPFGLVRCIYREDESYTVFYNIDGMPFGIKE